MENTKHTPGPWRANKATAGYVAVYHDNGKIVAALGSCDGPEDRPLLSSFTNPERTIANARLIAAAPDGLEANMAAWETRKRNDDGTWTISDRAMRMIDKAILKATQL